MTQPNWQRRAIAAKKTAEVLKRRVRALYNDGAATAIPASSIALASATRRAADAVR